MAEDYDDSYMWDMAHEAEEALRSEYFERLYPDVVADFTANRLCSFYLAHRNIAAKPQQLLAEAASLVPAHPTAALVAAVTALEVTFREVLLQPVIFGLVHADAAAATVTQLVVAQKDERFVKLLLDILAKHGGTDLRALTRSGSKKSLWEEMRHVRERRNRAVHRGELAESSDAEQAIEAARALLQDVFPALVSHLGLHMHGDMICDTPPAWTAACSPRK